MISWVEALLFDDGERPVLWALLLLPCVAILLAHDACLLLAAFVRRECPQ